jgi:hypothetical protein
MVRRLLTFAKNKLFLRSMLQCPLQIMISQLTALMLGDVQHLSNHLCCKSALTLMTPLLILSLANILDSSLLKFHLNVRMLSRITHQILSVVGITALETFALILVHMIIIQVL